ELIGDGIGDLDPAVAHVAVPQGGRRIEIAVAGRVLDPDALAGADDDLGVRDRVHVGEAVPERGSHSLRLSLIARSGSYGFRQDSIDNPIAVPYSPVSNSQLARRVSLTIVRRCDSRLVHVLDTTAFDIATPAA